ncbi:hypothetical protein GBA52_019323 [Prunus armeniaca]|nr:hypothetical protein GBA52_019323 [Prunus armeniaca]
MEGSSTTPDKELEKSQLFKTLKKVVAKQIAELKGMSTSKIDETTTNLQIVPSTSQETPQAKQTRSRTTLTGEFLVSFELPDDFPEDANVDTVYIIEAIYIYHYYRHERSNASLRSVVEVVRFILYEELPRQQSANMGKLKGSAEKMTKSASVKRKSSDAGCSKNPPEENKEGLDGPPKEKLVKLSPEAMEARVKAFLKAAYENLKNFKYFVSKEEKVSDGAKTEEVKVSKEEGESIVAPSSPKVASPNVPCKEEEAPINPPTELDQPNPPTEMDQPNPAVNHEEVGHGNASQNDGNGGDLIYGLLVQANTPKLATMEDEGNVSLLPPSDIEIKKEQLEMLGEFDHKVVQPQEAKGKFEDEMWSGDSSAIKAVPIQAIPAQATKVTMVDGRDYELPMGWLVEQRPRTSLKYLGKYCHEVKTRKRFRSLKAAKNWIMEANQGEQAHEPLEAGDGSN